MSDTQTVSFGSRGKTAAGGNISATSDLNGFMFSSSESKNSSKSRVENMEPLAPHLGLRAHEYE